MTEIHKLSEEIKVLKNARDILQEKYTSSDFHKKREGEAHEAIPSSPEDEEIYKLLNAIHQIEKCIKEIQDEQFKLLKKEEK